ncbi:TonB family protein [Agaribacter flavus]|uniref:Protein TonB n=1 Tax=Agaribacter flavus TaxID=1902781 RepID=A0ABV7FM22_9ALTE
MKTTDTHRILLMLSALLCLSKAAFADPPSTEKKLPCDKLSEEVVSDTDENTVKSISAFKPAQIVKRKNPRYPKSAAITGTEGWVKINFVIDTDGNVQDPVISDSSGNKAITRAAMSAVKRWKYSPAIKDNRAVQQCYNEVQLDFTLQNQIGASGKFITKYKEAEKAMTAGDMERAEKLIEAMKENGGGNRYENAWLWALDASVASTINDLRRELRSIDRTLASSNTHQGKYQTFDDEQIKSLYQRKFVLHLQFNEFSSALYTVDKVKKLANGEDILAPLNSYIEKINSLIQSEQNIIVKRSLSDEGKNFHYLVRNKFGFTKIEGQLDSVEVRCDSHHEKFTVALDHTWNIPESWGSCRVLVEGKAGTAFSLVELGNT